MGSLKSLCTLFRYGLLFVHVRSNQERKLLMLEVCTTQDECRLSGIQHKYEMSDPDRASK